MENFLFQTRHAGGHNVLVELAPDHPGFTDQQYRKRRNAIANIAFNYKTGDPIPKADYTVEEQHIWRVIMKALIPLHQQYACQEILDLQRFLYFNPNKMPQLHEVTEKLETLAGFRMEPVAGLVEARTFLSYLGNRIFLSTQYIRHHSQPFYTPEPDVVHELVGHAATLAHPGIAELNRLIGLAANIANKEELQRLSRIYWFSLEFGVLQQASEYKAFGAGLLSSVKEIQCFQQANFQEWDLDIMCQTPYDPTDIQETLFVAPSFTYLLTDISCWLRTGGWRTKK